ncbi:c-type cytochrome [Croceicoccus gelatinilyticus]|uniref:c-type cytochrome n=1 Tax=Croceicoccus gelatinilyticus TaxID=2835536 RepID=UPI001BCBE8FF|nr:c-type cytochrome [Croceicoccus gelatinilyticus]MBS7669077.1 c-type cytochrome [Croceicoccus gelatinilyticus]
MIKAVSGGILLSLLLVTQSQAGGGKPAGNAVRGKMLFMQCAACHAVKEGAPAKIGPNLAGIVGKKAAAQESFRYSPAMEKAAADGLKWTATDLDAFIAKPREKVPANRMSFGGISDEAKRRDIVAYLETL